MKKRSQALPNEVSVPMGGSSSTSSKLSPPSAAEPAAARTGGRSSEASQSGFAPPARPSRVGAVNHEAFIVDNKGQIIDFYDIDEKKLGEGSYGTVAKAVSKQTKRIRAIKTVGKSTMKNLDKFKQEITIMKKMDHPSIIKLYETFEDVRNIYLVLELCSGGELFDRIIEAGHFKEKQAAHLMQQTLSGINYMHQIFICHRDIKPENFLFSTKDSIEKSTLKIIDFGLSCQFRPGGYLKTKAGTPYYVAPQVLEGRYDQSCDIWSCGVIMFVLLCGYPPFYGENDNQVLQEVKRANLKFDPVDWKSVSEDAKALIRQMLTKSPSDRCTAEQAMKHVWITEKAPKAEDAPVSQNLVTNLKNFRVQNKLKKAALHVIATQLDESQISALRSVFKSLDTNGDGRLTAQELRDGLQKADIKEIPPDLQQIMEEVDSDGSGMIDYTEFLAATLDKKTYLQEDVCWAAFRVFDRNGDGKISKDELKLVLGEQSVGDAMHASAEAMCQILKEVDTNGDGEIDFKEFMNMMRGKGPQTSV
jgi:calcium-dependent protein kinase